MIRRLFSLELGPGPVILAGPEAHHGRDVLRLKPGDPVELFDGKGGAVRAVVSKLVKSEMILEAEAPVIEPVIGPEIALACAVPKFAHQETLVKMATELGVGVFQPLLCRYSSVREQFRPEKWNRWSLEACKQCGRNRLPEVRDLTRFDEFLAAPEPFDRLVYGDAQSNNEAIESRLHDAQRIAILVGPEGGFSPEELETLTKVGA